MREQELPEGTVTVLFSDVVGSTDLTTRRGDEAAQEILRAQRELVRGQVEEHSGHEVKSIGDGFMVAFASARRAVACAVGIQRAMEEHNRQPLDEQVLVRIGMNTGEVLQEEADLFGEAVNAAARIAAKAKGGQILISETTKGVLGRAKDVDLVDRGRFRLKGFPERWRLFEVVWQEEKPAVGPALVERTPFVGREAERADLRRLLDQVAGGRGGLVMIGGEPGVGKTRVAEELMAEARQRGMTALIGRCYEMEGTPPYIAFVEMAEAAARIIPPEALRDALGDSAPEVAKLMPELRRRFPDIPAPPELPPEQERRYLFNGMREFLARAGRAQPLLLVLDDLHWADEPTMLLLQHIAQQLHEMPVLIVGTYRDVELDVARPLARTLEELLRQRLAHRVALRRLPEAEVAAMLRALSGQEPPKPLVDAVYSETEGNPFFVEEVFQHLSEEGKLFDAQGRWRPDLQVSELEVPEGVRLVVGRRLERVGEECRRVLTSAAVIGRAFTFELLEALGEADVDTLLDAVDEAERAQLIASTADGPAHTGARPGEARFTFAHELIRQTLVSGLSLPRRQRMHLRVAEAIERAYARAPEEQAADLAHHLYQAGTAADPEKTVRYLTLAGQQAMASAAFEDALRHYDDAIALQPAEDRKAEADLLHKRGSALRSLGRWDEAMAVWHEAFSAYESLGDVDGVGRVCFEMASLLTWENRTAEIVEVTSRGLAVLGQRVSADRCRLWTMAAFGLSLEGAYVEAAGMLDDAVKLAEQLGDQGVLGQVLTYKAGHHFHHMQPLDVAEAGQRAAKLLRSVGDLWELPNALWRTQFGLLWLGRFGEVLKIGEEAEPLAARLGNLGALRLVRLASGQLQASVSGNIKLLEEVARADLELCRSAGIAWVSVSYAILGWAYFLQGRWNDAMESLQQAVRLEPPGFWAGGDWASLFICMAYAGERQPALAMLDERRSNLPRPGHANTYGAWLMLIGVIEGLTVLGERVEVAKLYRPVLEAAQTCPVTTMCGARSVERYAAMAAAAGSQWEKAEEHYLRSLQLVHELPLVIEQPEVRRWYARMLIDRDGPGDRDKARQLLTEAIAMYRDIGMPKHIEMAEAMLAEV